MMDAIFDILILVCGCFGAGFFLGEAVKEFKTRHYIISGINFIPAFLFLIIVAKTVTCQKGVDIFEY